MSTDDCGSCTCKDCPGHKGGTKPAAPELKFYSSGEYKSVYAGLIAANKENVTLKEALARQQVDLTRAARSIADLEQAVRTVSESDARRFELMADQQSRLEAANKKIALMSELLKAVL